MTGARTGSARAILPETPKLQRQEHPMSHFIPFRKVALVGLTAAALVGGSAFAAAPASAADANTGWVRIGHFSPDTKGVDVEVSALSGGTVVTELDNVTYGQVSKYLDMQAGTYAISMRPTGSSKTSKPMLTRSLTVKPGSATTVAAYGPNKGIKTAVYNDDLTTPKAGNARIRLIQVSTKHKSVSVKTTTGIQIASKATTGSATGYASVAAGPWALAVSGSGTSKTQVVDLTPGTVNTLLVLDNATGGVTLDTLTDSAAVAQAPQGGVQTGGGYFATHRASIAATSDHRVVAY